jgi:CRP-like cAMP-binding protein
MLLNDAAIQALFAKKGKTFAPDSVIFLEDEKGTDMFIIVSGEVEISKSYREEEIFGGSRLTLGTISENLCILGPGDFFGEMALWNDEPRSASARARNQVDVIVLTKSDIEALVLRSPAIAVQMLKSVCARLRDSCRTPRLESVLPQIQELIHSLQHDRRSPTKKAEKPAGAVDAAEFAPGTPIATTVRPEGGDGRATAGRKGERAASLDETSSARDFRKCPGCAETVSADDRYCRRCGKPLALAAKLSS